MSKSPRNYGADQITTLPFLEAIRQRPGMYIGNNTEFGLRHILMEIVDNAVDECMAGYASQIDIVIEKDGTVSVSDNGRGIPVLIASEETESALTMALTQPHTGGKFAKGDESAYSSSGGLHGIGAKATNAFSEILIAEIHRHGLVFRQVFKNGGIPDTPVEIYDPTGKKKIAEIGPKTTVKLDSKDIAVQIRSNGVDIPFKADPSLHTGTTIRFRPNRVWFSPEMEWPNPEQNVPWDIAKLETRFAQVAYLYPGVKLTLLDQHADKPERKDFYSEKGLVDYLIDLNTGLDALHKPILYDITKEVVTDGQPSNARIQVAMQYAGDETNIYSFVNAIPTYQGGTHEAGYKAGLTKAIKTFATQKKLLKGEEDVRGDDLLLGLTAVISITMTGTPQFQSQTKEALTSPEIQGAVLSATYEALSGFFNKNGNAQIAAIILNQAKAAARGREAATQARKLVIGKSALGGASEDVLGKLSDIQRRGGEPLVALSHTALFLVEGDSAGGCLTGETLIPLANGENRSMKDLTEDWQKGITHFGYASNDQGELQIVTLREPHITKTAQSLVEVRLENGKKVRCTPDHPFRIHNGEYLPASKLNPGDELMSMTPRIEKVKSVRSFEANQPVYDLEVEHYHNFAVTAGVIVHNSCKQARNSRMHAILPLRGKVLNVAKRSRIDEALKNREVRAIVAAIGGGIGDDFTTETMRFGHVVILTDADTDGLHIATLLMTFFWELMRPLVKEGRLWVAVPPLYQVRKLKGGESRYVYRAAALSDTIQDMGGSDAVTVQRYKGLGEMNPEQLRDTIFRVESNPDQPYSADHFLTVQVEDPHVTNRMIQLLMSEEVGPRREWLMNANWNTEA
jgi:Type IIA topoisomerase (DNA gyrase/topo II, topoisomerase IV), B subunit